MKGFLIAAIAACVLLVAAGSAEAGIRVRRTPFNPFRGPVPVAPRFVPQHGFSRNFNGHGFNDFGGARNFGARGFGVTRSFVDRFGRIVTVDQFGRVIAIQ